MEGFEQYFANAAAFIVTIGPSLVSIITMIATVIVAIKKCFNVSNENLQETKSMIENSAAAMAQMKTVLEENGVLKNQVLDTINTTTAHLQQKEEEIELLKQQVTALKEQTAQLEKLSEENETIKKQLSTIISNEV